MVVFQVRGYREGGAGGTVAFCAQLEKKGVLMFPYGGRGESIRAVTHRHIDEQAVEDVVAIVRDILVAG